MGLTARRHRPLSASAHAKPGLGSHRGAVHRRPVMAGIAAAIAAPNVALLGCAALMLLGAMVFMPSAAGGSPRPAQAVRRRLSLPAYCRCSPYWTTVSLGASSRPSPSMSPPDPSALRSSGPEGPRWSTPPCYWPGCWFPAAGRFHASEDHSRPGSEDFAAELRRRLSPTDGIYLLTNNISVHALHHVWRHQSGEIDQIEWDYEPEPSPDLSDPPQVSFPAWIKSGEN